MNVHPSDITSEAHPKVELLECTLRDGNYAVDFKFTESDTAILTSLLSGLGFKWIEVGHGFGLNAGDAGKGPMPSSDEHIIAAAKERAGRSLIGAFCIPGIARLENLKSARDAGLDFVRIGYDAPIIEESIPFIERARDVGLIPYVNFMKTYAITPQEFARKAEIVLDAGAEGVYCVDSAGNMFPDDVGAYISALLDKRSCEVGFHAHNNLQLAMANAMKAVSCGAQLIDTTLYGIGRSAGNIPTELALAVLGRVGVDFDIDLFEVMEVAERYMRPLMARIHMYDMTSVAMGYSGFHSSFYGAVKTAAAAHQVDPRRLIAAMGEIDPVHLDQDVLEQTASSLPKQVDVPENRTLLEFHSSGLTSETLDVSMAAVDRLLVGLEAAAAKARTAIALEFSPSLLPSEELVLADFVFSTNEASLGRIVFGSFDVLEEILEQVVGRVDVPLFNLDGGQWGLKATERISAVLGQVRHIRPNRLLQEHIELALLQQCPASPRQLLIYGSPAESLVESLATVFRRILLIGPTAWPEDHLSVAVVRSLDDSRLAGESCDTCLCLAPPQADDAELLTQLLDENATVFTLGEMLALAQVLEDTGVRTVRIDSEAAYCGLIARLQAVDRLKLTESGS